MSHFSKKHKIHGFTLVELLVSIGIMAVMLSVVLTSQSKYTGVTALNNDAGDIYLTLRQSQTYGVGVREFTPGSLEFNISYGVSFNTTSSGSNDAYVFFADRGGQNGRYDSGWECPLGGASECLEKMLLSQGNTISEICYVRINGTEFCNLGGVDITFSRPDVKANFAFFNTAGNTIGTPSIKGAKIELVSPGGVNRTILVYTTGQISVQ